MSMTRLDLACACGGIMRVRFSPPDVKRERELIELWKDIHTTPECSPATPAQASRARRRAESPRLDNQK